MISKTLMARKSSPALDGHNSLMPRLRRIECSGPGLARVRRGRGFEYRDEHGERIADEEVLERIAELAVPPAWRDVWICPYPMGHIQATGIDAAGRKQYRYHDRWRERRDREKFDSMVEFAALLPRLRRRVTRDLRVDGMPRERALGCAVRLLDRGSFRIGSEQYAEDNETYGLATMRSGDVTVDGTTVAFDYLAKGAARRRQTVNDRAVATVIRELKRRRGEHELLAYRVDRRWSDVRSSEINDYIKRAIGDQFSAKDFRTWHGTVLAAVALAAVPEDRRASKTARKRAIRGAVEQVSEFLGNTPAVCRASYIDPKVLDRFEGGEVIDAELPRLAAGGAALPRLRPALEASVLRMLGD